MTQAQIDDIYSNLAELKNRMDNIEILTSTIGTTQVAVSQILEVQAQHTRMLEEILRLLRDRNGGSGL